MRRASIIAASSLLVAAAVAGCSSKAPDAVTVSSGTPAATISDTGSPSADATTSSPPPQQVTPLTKAQLTAALPTAKELGKGGWKIAKSSSTSSSSKEKVSPAACKTVYDSLEPDLSGNKVASVDRDYKASDWGPFVSVTMTSYKQVPAQGVFDALAQAMSTCPKFTSTNAKGVKSSYSVAPLKFPNVGDQTFAIRMTVSNKSGGFNLTMTVDVAMATKGAASVAVINAGLGKLFLPSTSLTAMKAALAGLPD